MSRYVGALDGMKLADDGFSHLGPQSAHLVAISSEKG